MKNICHLIKLLPLAAALLTAGCGSDPLVEESGIPATENKAVVLSARIVESDDAPDETSDEASRTAVDVETLKVLWSSGDRIALFPNGKNTVVAATLREEYAGSAVGKFEPESAVTTTAEHYALYPYSEGQTIDEATHRMVTTLPVEQSYREGSYGGMTVPMSAYAAAEEDYTLHFRTYVGAIGIQLTGNVRVGKIRVVSETEEVAGEIDIEHRPGSMPKHYPRKPEKTVTLLCPENTVLGSETQLFCIALLPNTYQRLTVTIYDDQGNEVVTRTASNLTINRAKIRLMQPLVLEKPTYETYLGDWLVTGIASDTGMERSYRINISEKVYGESYNVKGWSSVEEGLTYPFELRYLAADGSVSASFGQKVYGSYEGFTGIYVLGFYRSGSSLYLQDGTMTGLYANGRIPWKLSDGMEAFEYFLQNSNGSFSYYNSMTHLLNPVSTREPTAPQDYFDHDVVQFQEHTKGKGVRLIIMGDGYTAAHDLNKGGKFERDAHRAHEEYFAVEPYKTLRPYFDVYMIAAASADRGTSIISRNQTRNTCFSAVLEGGGSTGISCDDNKVFSFAAEAGVVSTDEDLRNSVILLLINEDYYAGTCSMYYDPEARGYNICMVPVMSGDMFGKTLRHESGGHGWGHLGDEYCYYDEPIPASKKESRQFWMDAGYYPNCTFETRDNAPWAHYYTRPGYEMVGYFEGALLYYQGVWRPEEISCMEDNRNYFNAPSRERIWYRTMVSAGETFSLDEFLAYDKINIGAAAAAAKRSMVERPMPPLGEPIMKDNPPSLDEICREVEQRRKATATAVTLP